MCRYYHIGINGVSIHSFEFLYSGEELNIQEKYTKQVMRKKKNIIFIIWTTAIILVIIITAGIKNHNTLSARTETEKSIVTEEKTPVKESTNSNREKIVTSETSVEINPANANIDLNTTGAKDEKSTPDKKSDSPEKPVEIIPVITDQNTTGGKDENSIPAKHEQIYIMAEDISNHPEIILNAYKEAYPDLITDVIKGEKDWTVKFANGNLYYWADGKILPESALKKSEKYISYSINPYNINGRSPELYTEEKIKKLRVINRPSGKKRIVLSEEGGLYKELFAITAKKSAKKQLTEVRLCGHYITVHHNIAEKIRLIDSKIHLLAKTDPEVRSYLKNISSIEAFNWRNIAGSDHKSNHSFGIAIDILPKKYHKKTIYWSWEQEKNRDWMLLPQSRLWAPPDPVVKIFLEERFIWGGNWDKYDTMHFEYRPELIFLSKNIKFNQ